MAAFAQSGCAELEPAQAAIAELSEEEKIDHMLDGLGIRPESVEFVGEDIIVDGDILFSRDAIETQLEQMQVSKAFVCNSSMIGFDEESCDSSASQPVQFADRIELRFDPDVPQVWRDGFHRAAYAWSNAYAEGRNAAVSIDPDGDADSIWVIRITTGVRGYAAFAAFPQYANVGHGIMLMVPGQEIRINEVVEDPDEIAAVAVHELGHTLGFAHPGDGDHLSGTAFSIVRDCGQIQEFLDESSTPVYETVMCTGIGPEYLTDDDVMAAHTLFPPVTSGVRTCSSNAQCTGGMICGNRNGPAAGFATGTNTCKHPRPPQCRPMNGTADMNLCTEDCPCSLGEGDCDNDDQCIGDLVCAQDVGSHFGLFWGLEVCVRPEVADSL